MLSVHIIAYLGMQSLATTSSRLILNTETHQMYVLPCHHFDSHSGRQHQLLPVRAAPVLAPPFARTVSSRLAGLEANGDIKGQHRGLLLAALRQDCCQCLRLMLTSQPGGSS